MNDADRTPAETTADTGTALSEAGSVDGSTPSSADFSVLRSAIGSKGDIPVPVAVLRVDIDEDAHVATDARYAYASEEYCRAISREVAGVIGHSSLEIGEGDKADWLAQCYRAVALKESVRGFCYDSLVRDWISYSLVPSAIPGCCVYTFIRMALDDSQRRQLMATSDARTSRLISEMLSELSAEQSYDAAMNAMLRMLSAIIHADRLGVFECSGNQTKMTFELCAPGVVPQVGMSSGVTRGVLRRWFRNVMSDHVVLVPNISVIERFSAPLYQWCRASGVHSLMAAPFFNDGEIVGFLGAYNYQFDEEIDLNRFFEAVSTFIAARIENRQLIDSLRRMGTHDTLTDLLNRRGARQEIDTLLTEKPDGRYVLALIDIDDFKRVNDVYGHPTGDEALRAMAAILKQAFPEEAILSRNGGDEFLVMLWGEAAAQASNRLASLTQRGLDFSFEGARHQLSISVGYARYPEQASDLRELISRADAALYAVKLGGKAGFGKYTPEVETLTRTQLGFSARDLLENAPYPFVVCGVDERHDMLFASQELARLLDYGGMNELMRSTGGRFCEIVSPEDRDRVCDELRRQVGEGSGPASFGLEPRSLSFCLIRREGGTVAVRAACHLVDIEETGKVFYLLVSADAG